MILTRACLKKAFRELRVPVCGRFYPNEGGVAGYGNRMRVKYTAKWGLQIAEMIFQTRSNTGVYNVRKNEKTRSPYPLYQADHKRYVLRIVKSEKFYENYSYRDLQKC